MKNSRNSTHIRVSTYAAGFTIVEIIVTISVTGIFLMGAVMWYKTVESQRLMALRQSIAADLATINLNKFTSRPTLASCANAIDLAAFYTQETISTYSNLSQLPSPTQSMTAYPVDGCNGTAFVSQVLKIVSTVTYQTNGTASRVAYLQ